MTNPLASEGGADPVGIDALRGELPLSRTLDRVVSLTDFADFALTYSGVAAPPSGSRSPACLHRAWR